MLGDQERLRSLLGYPSPPLPSPPLPFYVCQSCKGRCLVLWSSRRRIVVGDFHIRTQAALQPALWDFKAVMAAVGLFQSFLAPHSRRATAGFFWTEFERPEGGRLENTSLFGLFNQDRGLTDSVLFVFPQTVTGWTDTQPGN